MGIRKNMHVYLTTNRINDRKYIGRDSTDRPKYLGSGVFLKQAILKYGRENFERVNLEECSTLRELIDREKAWIEHFNAVESEEFYNVSEGTGGFGPNDRHTDETKRLISERCRGRKLTEEQRAKRISELTGREPWNKGRKLDRDSEEYRKNYGHRKVSPVPLSNELMIDILRDYDTGKFTFAELTAKYNRVVKNAQIIRYREKIETSTRGSGGT